jgi:hypothetical protein
MDWHLAAKNAPLFVLRLFAIAELLRVIRALSRRILIDNLFGPDLFRGFLSWR